MYILDTNVLSAARRSDRAPQVRAWLSSKPESELFLSVITVGEIERGIRLQEWRNPDFAHDLQNWLDRTMLVFADRLLSFDAEAARILGRLSAEIGHSDADLMIAATALRHDATVVTANISDFAPTGVKLESPF